jgi:hypothetical protein
MFCTRRIRRQPRGKARALAQARGERTVEKVVNFLQEGAVSAACEARVLLVGQAKRNELRRFELRADLDLVFLAFALGEIARHAHDLEALVLQVMHLLGIEREDAIGEGTVRTHEGGDLAQHEHFRSREPMPPIRCPQSAVLTAHDDEGIEERAGLIDLRGEPLGMRGG